MCIYTTHPHSFRSSQPWLLTLGDSRRLFIFLAWAFTILRPRPPCYRPQRHLLHPRLGLLYSRRIMPRALASSLPPSHHLPSCGSLRLVQLNLCKSTPSMVAPSLPDASRISKWATSAHWDCDQSSAAKSRNRGYWWLGPSQKLLANASDIAKAKGFREIFYHPPSRIAIRSQPNPRFGGAGASTTPPSTRLRSLAAIIRLLVPSRLWARQTCPRVSGRFFHQCRASHSGSIFLLRFHSRPRFHHNRVLQLMDVVLQWAADHCLRLRWRSLQVGAIHSRSAHRLRMVLQPLFRHHAPSCRGGLPILGHLPVNIYHPHPKRLAPSAPSGTTALPAFRLRPGPMLSRQAMSRPSFNHRPNARARPSHGGVKALSTHPRARGRGSWPSKPCHPRR